MKAVTMIFLGGLTLAGGMLMLGSVPWLGLGLMLAGPVLSLWGLVRNHQDHIRR